jgi:hypothetical protein
MSIEENKLLTVQWHTLLYRLIIKYKLSCILVEHLDIDTPMFDTIIGKRANKNKDMHIPFSEYAFGRLMTSEHYMMNQFQYRQIRATDMMNFQYELKPLSL